MQCSTMLILVKTYTKVVYQNLNCSNMSYILFVYFSDAIIEKYLRELRSNVEVTR